MKYSIEIILPVPNLGPREKNDKPVRERFWFNSSQKIKILMLEMECAIPIPYQILAFFQESFPFRSIKLQNVACRMPFFIFRRS